MSDDAPAEIIHASTIALNGAGALILGASGRGKSTLALQMMGLGCALVADDRTCLHIREGQLVASPPKAIAGQIEVRRFAILPAAHLSSAHIVCAVDLDHGEKQRLPDPSETVICGKALRLFHNPGKEVLPFALLQYLKAYADQMS